MKKSLVAALTGALVVGATATTFAAANPFSDVPAGHWAYNSVTKLANEGVIEGYGDGTFRGQRNITRYEMAQMIARALAKSNNNMSYATRAELEKLAAEFREELDSLGLRVEELEKHADKVKWAGKIEYTYGHLRQENGVTGDKNSSISNGGVFRLEPVAEINDHWNAVARFDAGFDVRNDSTTDAKLKRVYAEGKYDKFGIKLGRFGFCPPVEDGMVVDTVASGVELSYGDKWKFTLTAGRVGADSDEAHYYTGLDAKNALLVANQSNADAFYPTVYGSTTDADGWGIAAVKTGTVVDANGDVQTVGIPVTTVGMVSMPNLYTYSVDGTTTDVLGNAYYTVTARDVVTGSDMAQLGKLSMAIDNTYNVKYADMYTRYYNAAVAAGFSAADSAFVANARAISDANALLNTNAASIAAFANATHPTDIIGLNIGYADNGEKGLYGLASYYYAKDKDFQNNFYSTDGTTDKANVWALSLGYRFSDKLKLWGGYAKNTKADLENNAWQAEVRYGTYGDYAEKGAWAVWLGYAKFGYNVGIATNQTDDVQTGTKGWHIGAAYAPFKNVGLLFRYSNGKYITSGDKYRKVFARAEWFF